MNPLQSSRILFERRPAVFAWTVILALAVLAVGSGQERHAHRTVISDRTLPAVDRGLRLNDAPRPARSAPRHIVVSGADDTALSGHVIVKFLPGTDAAARLQALESAGATGVERPSWANFELVAIDGGDPEAVSQQLNLSPEVEYAQPRYTNYAFFSPNDPLYPMQWNLHQIEMERAWTINPGATASVTVAVLDSGIAYRDALIRFNANAWRIGDGPVFPSLGPVDVPFSAAPDLAAPDRFVSPYDFIWEDDLPLDLDGHGTHVAGTIGQLTDNGVGVAGMAFNVRLMPVKVVPGLWDLIFGAPAQPTDDLVARGIRYAADNGAHVINMSIGRETGGPAPVIEDAIRYAVSQGVFVAIAAGNDFETGNRPSLLAEIAARIDGAVSVSAVNRQRARAHYSTTGPSVEIAAPGGSSRVGGRQGMILQQSYDFDVVDTYARGPYRAPRFDFFTFEHLQGTSMAAPHVAGFAALLHQQGIRNPAAIEAAMTRFATDLGAPGRNDEFGAGLISPRDTLRGLGLAR